MARPRSRAETRARAGARSALPHQVVPKQHRVIEGRAPYAVEHAAELTGDGIEAHDGGRGDAASLNRDDGMDDGAIAVLMRPQSGLPLRTELEGCRAERERQRQSDQERNGLRRPGRLAAPELAARPNDEKAAGDIENR